MNPRVPLLARSLSACLLFTFACASGTETDNPATSPLVRFAGSVCKKEAARTTSGSGSTREPFVTSSDHDGLSCVEWEPGNDGELALKFSNVEGPCSVPWRGTAKAAGERAFALLASNPTCEVARCGSCLYDFEFVLEEGDPAGLELTLSLASCEGKPPERSFTLTLPEDAPASGILCRYAPARALEEQLARTGECGSRFSPCGDASACDVEPPCEEGLTCAAVEDPIAAERCLASCTVDEDCVPSGVTRCEGGVCTVPAGF